MKKTALLLVLLLGSVTCLLAQKDLTVNLQGAVNIANLVEDSGNSVLDNNWRVLPSGGAMLELGLSESWALKAGLLYDGKGMKYEFNNRTLNVGLHYLSVPVLAKLKFPVGVDIHAGPKLGVLMAARGKARSGSGTENMSDHFNKIDFGLVIGVGYTLPSAPVTFFGQYEIGFVNVADKTYWSSVIGQSRDNSLQTSTFSIGVSVKFWDISNLKSYGISSK